jgi:hypothetical protein
MEELNLEDLIRQTLHEEANRIDAPPPDKIWANIAGGKEVSRFLKKFATKHKLSVFQLVAASLVVLFLGAAVYFLNPPTADALSSRVLKTVVEFFIKPEPPSDITISMSNTSSPPPGAPPPPPDWPLATGERVVTLEQAQSEASFSFKKPSYLPRGMTLDIVTVLDKYAVNQYYRSDKNRLIIGQQYMPGDFASSSFFAGGRVKKVNIKGIEGTLVVQHNPHSGKDRLHILWFDDKIRFEMDTDLSEREALKIARSLE